MQNLRQPMFVFHSAVFVLLCAAVILSSGVGVATDSAYNISVEGSYETPTDSVTVEGEQFTVHAVGVDSGRDEITVSVDAPADAEYQINLYTLDQQIQDFRTATGSETVTFDTSLVNSGSYVVAAVNNDDFFDVHPVVVADYRLKPVIPDRVTTNTSISTSVTVEATPGENQVGTVELAVWNNTWRDRSRLQAQGNGRYVGSLPSLSNGTYRVSTAAIAAERVDGEKNVLGVSEPTTVVADSTITGPINDSDNISPPKTDPGSSSNDSTGTRQDDDADVLSPKEAAESADDRGNGFGWTTVFIGVVLLGIFQLGRLVSAPK